MATIIFKDGTELSVKKNGTCFILDEKPTFPDDLSVVIIRDEKGENVINDALLIECASVDGQYWFSFIEEDKKEKEIRELREDMEDALNGLLEFVLGGE
jgi:hypothetical protein